MKIYGKTSNSIISQKESFFEDNKKHVINQKKIAQLYIKQPKRTNCKNCDNQLLEKIDFVKDCISYKLCSTCGHINGGYEDTNEFCELVYTQDDGVIYSENYTSKDLEAYNYRVSTIYIPKAEFLYTSLKNDGANVIDLNYLDFGAGSGYFVSALNKIGLVKVKGSEVSESQVGFGNNMMNNELLNVHELKNTEEVLLNTKANVVSMIGVLEHLQNPREALLNISKNENIKYIYLSLPLFSLSVYIEMLSDEIFHRQLHGGHTHLYSEESLHYIIDEFNFSVVSEWWFGTDIMDLFRNIVVNLDKQNSSEQMKEKCKRMFSSTIDSLQLELDKKHYSSEVHILLKK